MEVSRRAATKALLKRQRKMHARRMEIEKLKAEYEKFKDLNEQIIESKMRQVRLKRLFREIEELKEISALRAKQRPSPRKPKTEEEIRFDNIKRARALGQEFSRLNALVHYSEMIDDLKAEELINKANQKLYFLEKRLAYGNAVSKTNTRGSAKPISKKEWNARKPEASRLQNRLSYGNTHSYINVLLGLNKKNRSVLAELLREEFNTSSEGSSELQTPSEKKSLPDREKKYTHQDLLDEIQQMQSEKDEKRKIAQLKALGLNIKDLNLEKEIKKSLKHRESKMRKNDSDDDIEISKKPIKKAKKKQLQFLGSSSGEELSARPRYIEDSLLSKKQELSSLNLSSPGSKTKSSRSFDDFEDLTKRSKENLQALVKHPGVQKQLRAIKQGANASELEISLTTSLEQIRNFFNNDDDDDDDEEAMRKVAAKFGPEIRKAVEIESSKYFDKPIETAKADEISSDNQTQDYENKYIF